MKRSLIVCLAVLLAACSEAPPTDPDVYLFLGHGYDWQQENRVDPRIPYLPLDEYTGIWLGGDICGRASKEQATIDYLDSLFQLNAPGNHWAVGNHDLMDGDLNRITTATGRPDFYSTFQNSLCILVLNTNLFWHQPWAPPRENCEEKKQQLALLKAVCDTLQSASHLLVLHHHSLFNELKVDRQGTFIDPGNISGRPIRSSCDSLSDLTEEVYPLLVEVQERGIPVVCVGGDYGMVAKQFSYTTPEGVVFLGSGINNSLDMYDPADYVKNFNADSVLLFRHWPAEKRLEWEFRHFGQLLQENLGSEALHGLPKRVRTLMEKL